MELRIQCLSIDTTDPARLAGFWESALGWRRTYERDDEVVLEPPAGSPEDGIVPDLLFLRVPEGKRGEPRTDFTRLSGSVPQLDAGRSAWDGWASRSHTCRIDVGTAERRASS
jgi:hypothetical protein